MGGSISKKYKGWKTKSLKAQDKIGKPYICPVCNKFFPKSTTYYSLNSHVDSCLGNDENQPQNEGDIEIQRQASNELQEKYFNLLNNFDTLRIPFTDGCSILTIERQSLYKNTIAQINECNLRKELKIQFKGELSVETDAGGGFREFCNIYFKEAIQKFKLLIKCDTSQLYYKINPESERPLEEFSILGKILAKAFFDRITIRSCLSPLLYYVLLEKEIAPEQLALFDESMCQSMQYLLNNKVSEECSLYFYIDRNGTQIPLIKNGTQIPVTEQNKAEFVTLMINYIAHKEVEDKLQALKSGFFSVIPSQTLDYFEPEEVFHMMNGANLIDIDDWCENTVYETPYSKTHNVIKDFWKMISKMSNAEREQVLQFTTGSTSIPIGGFKYLESNRGHISKFTIISATHTPGKLPSAHICFNRLILPQYPDINVMMQSFKKCVDLALVGFGIE